MTEHEKAKRKRGSGSLRVRGGVFWLRYHHRGERVEESSGVRDDGTAEARNKALNKLRQKTKTADTEAHVPPSALRLTFEELMEMVRADYAEKGNRTADRLPTLCRRLADAFGGRKAVTITTKAVAEYARMRLAEGRARSTVNEQLALLRHAFKIAVALEAYPASAVPTITTPEPKNVRKVFLDPGEAELFMTELRAREPVAADAVELGLFTALRRENVLSLEWDWFSFPPVAGGHLTGGTLTVPQTKNGDPLTLPLTGRLLAVVDRRWQVRVPACPYVFHRNGKRVVTFAKAWDEAAAAIGRGRDGARGKRPLTFHDLRRSAARILRRAKVDPLTIMERGGWKTPSMFRRYAITDEQDQRDANAALDAAFTTTTPVLPLRRTSSNR